MSNKFTIKINGKVTSEWTEPEGWDPATALKNMPGRKFSEGTIALGNLFTQTLPEILQSPRVAAMAAGFAARNPSEELCRRCGYARRFIK